MIKWTWGNVTVNDVPRFFKPLGERIPQTHRKWQRTHICTRFDLKTSSTRFQRLHEWGMGFCTSWTMVSMCSLEISRMNDKREEEKKERQRKLQTRASSLSRDWQGGEIRVAKWPLLWFYEGKCPTLPSSSTTETGGSGFPKSALCSTALAAV